MNSPTFSQFIDAIRRADAGAVRNLLHAACDSGHIELSRRLLEAGMHRDAQDEQGRTPRERALAQGHHDLAALL